MGYRRNTRMIELKDILTVGIPFICAVIAISVSIYRTKQNSVDIKVLQAAKEVLSRHITKLEANILPLTELKALIEEAVKNGITEWENESLRDEIKQLRKKEK